MVDVEQVVRDFLVKERTRDRADVELTDETDLLEEDILDSLGVMLLITHLQEQFDVEIPPEQVVMENFRTVSAIAGLMNSLGDGAPP